MATKLSFDKQFVGRLVDHARGANEHRVFYEKVPKAGLFLVKDSGVYLMSSGLPMMPAIGNPEHNFVVYAAGYAPTDADAYENACDALGGDDFAVLIPLEMFERALASGEDKIILRASERSVSVLIPRPRKTARRSKTEKRP